MNLFSGSKLVYHLAMIDNWQRTGTSYPILIELDMTNSCDHKCPQCVCKSVHSSDKLSLSESKSVLAQAKDFGCTAVLFTGGGDPLLNSSFLPTVEFAHGLGLDVGIITHGGHIDEETARVIAQHSQWCRVSLDAANPEMYRTVHGVGRKEWEKATRGISYLVQQKAVLNSAITLGIGYLVDRQTSPEMTRIAELGTQLGVDYVQFRPFRGTDLDAREYVHGLQRQFRDSKTRILCSESRYQSLNVPRHYTYCRATNFVAVVGADYQLYVCCDTKYKADAWLGDLRENTLRQIWQSDTRAKKNGTVYEFCPHPCRHDSNNQFLEQVQSNPIHKNFI